MNTCKIRDVMFDEPDDCLHLIRESFGAAFVQHAQNIVSGLAGGTITIGIIGDNVRLKNWYRAPGFISTGTKQFERLPFTAG